VRRLRRNRWLGLVLVPPRRISIATLHRRTGFLKIAMPTQQLQVARVINAPQVEWNNMIVVCMPIGAEEVCKISPAENAPAVIPAVDGLLNPHRNIRLPPQSPSRR